MPRVLAHAVLFAMASLLLGSASPVRAQVGGSTPPTQNDAAASVAPPVASAAAPAYLNDPKFQKALTAAHEHGLNPDEKLDRLKKANKIAGNQCVECLRAMSQLELQANDWKEAATSARQWASVATDKTSKLQAEYMIGSVLMHSNDDKPKPDALREADDAFQAALALAPHNRRLLYEDGRLLAMEGRDAEAKAVFQQYVQLAPASDRYRIRAEHFVDNPHMASLPMAPPFTLTTAAGEKINLDDQVGKVVLLDFWATWCGPCKETLPEVHAIAKKFAGQPLLVVSISSDKDADAWKEFIAKNDMFWTQYRDSDHALSDAYGVSSIPRFFTIDSDGVLQSVKVGADADIEGDLKKLLKRAEQDASRKATATDKAPAGQ